MTDAIKKIVTSMVFLSAVCIGLWLSSEARAEILAADQEAFNPATETTDQSTPVPGGIDLEDDKYRPAHYDSPKTYTGEKISLEFKNEEIINIIKSISEAAGKKIVVPDTVSGRLTLKLRDVPWDQALDIVLSSRNLGVEESGNVLTVYELPSLHGRIRPRSYEPSPADRQNSRLSPLAKKIFTPKYLPVGQVETELKKLKSERGKILAIGNDVYVEDEPGAIAAMSQIFMRLDTTATRQILIEARIVEAGPSLTEALELQWKGGEAESGPAMNNSDVDGEVKSKAQPTKLAYDVINKGKSLTLNSKFTADENSVDSRTIMAPRIMAANDQKVSIKQGKQTYCGSGRSNAANVRFKELELELTVTPHLEENGQILTLDFQLAEPLLNIKEAGLKLQLEDGETVVLGGIIVDDNQGSDGHLAQGSRYSLSDWLFKDRPNKDREILIFVTATIIPINI